MSYYVLTKTSTSTGWKDIIGIFPTQEDAREAERRQLRGMNDAERRDRVLRIEPTEDDAPEFWALLTKYSNDCAVLFENGDIADIIDEECMNNDQCEELWSQGYDGAMYCDIYKRDGDMEDGPEIYYRNGMTLGEWCENAGLPKPVAYIPGTFIERLQDGEDAATVFAGIDAYREAGA